MTTVNHAGLHQPPLEIQARPEAFLDASISQLCAYPYHILEKMRAKELKVQDGITQLEKVNPIGISLTPDFPYLVEWASKENIMEHKRTLQHNIVAFYLLDYMGITFTPGLVKNKQGESPRGRADEHQTRFAFFDLGEDALVCRQWIKPYMKPEVEVNADEERARKALQLARKIFTTPFGKLIKS